MEHSRAVWIAITALTAAAAVVGVRVGAAQSYTDWAPAVNVQTIDGTHPEFNTAALDGCPAPTRNGHSFYMASSREGGYGGLDIWVAHRRSVNAPWGEPVNLGPTINTAADEFCPAPTRTGRGLLFVSTKAGGCGGSDIYIARKHASHGWTEPVHLGCEINSSGEEASPFIVKHAGATELYFSSTRTGNSDIYVSTIEPTGSFGAPAPVTELNTHFGDFRPNVRRDGLEIFFDSNRPGSLGLDIWTATRSSVREPWSTPVLLGLNVNSAANESRPFLSWDGTTLYFGSTRIGGEGLTDIYLTTREKVAPGQ